MKVNAAKSAVTCRCATETGKVLGPYLTLLRGIALEHESIRWARTRADARRPTIRTLTSRETVKSAS